MQGGCEYVILRKLQCPRRGEERGKVSWLGGSSEACRSDWNETDAFLMFRRPEVFGVQLLRIAFVY